MQERTYRSTMGMSASQGRLLMMTARLSNNEFEQQCVAYSKQRLADDSQAANDLYLDALQETQYQVLVGYSGDNPQYDMVSYNTLTDFNHVGTGKQYIVSDNKGQILVENKIADAFKTSNGNYNEFLKYFGLTPIADRDITEEQVHQAWDRYLVSVGKGDENGIYLSNGATNHITGFSYNIGWKTKDENGNLLDVPVKGTDYVTYNAANATVSTPDGDEYKFSMIFDDKTNEYVVENAPIKAESYIDENGNTEYAAYIVLSDLNHGDQKLYLNGVYATPVENAYSEGIKYVDEELSFESQDGSQGFIFYLYNSDNGEKVRLCNENHGNEVERGRGYDNSRNCCIDVLSFVNNGFELESNFNGDVYLGTKCISYPMYSYQSLFNNTSGIVFNNNDGDVLYYEGATEQQRELYDYAMALTERYAYYTFDSEGENPRGVVNGGTSINHAAVNKLNALTYDADKVQYYSNIFKQMTTNGYTTYEEMVKEDYITPTTFKSSTGTTTDALSSYDWLVNNIKNGKLTIAYYSANEKAFIKTTLDDDESIVNKENKSKMAIAEQIYQNHMDRIEAEDKRFDMQLTKLESEHTALQTEYESVAKVISKNVEKTFGIFNA